MQDVDECCVVEIYLKVSESSHELELEADDGRRQTDCNSTDTQWSRGDEDLELEYDEVM